MQHFLKSLITADQEYIYLLCGLEFATASFYTQLAGLLS